MRDRFGFDGKRQFGLERFVKPADRRLGDNEPGRRKPLDGGMVAIFGRSMRDSFV